MYAKPQTSGWRVSFKRSDAHIWMARRKDRRPVCTFLYRVIVDSERRLSILGASKCIPLLGTCSIGHSGSLFGSALPSDMSLLQGQRSSVGPESDWRRRSRVVKSACCGRDG